MAYVQNRIVFFPEPSGRCFTKECTSGVGRMPITGVPMISRSKSWVTDGSGASAMLKIGASRDSDMTSAKRLVLPVREMYRTQAFMVPYSNRLSYNLCFTPFQRTPRSYATNRTAKYAIISTLKVNSEPTFNVLKRFTLFF